MKVDKQNKKVAFSEETHTYWDVDTNDKYISVTTLIGKFENEFDKDFWSKYKALERILGKDRFQIEKKKLLQTKRFDISCLSTYDILKSDFIQVQQDILKEWEEKNKASCERGTKIHAQLEAYSKGGKFKEKIAPRLNYKIDNLPCFTNSTENELLKTVDKGIFPEYLIYRQSDDNILRLAGQIDLLIKNGNDIYIIDFKTNEKIDLKLGFDTSTKKSAMMKYPLNNIQDSNYWHYTLQLSTYAWMVQKINPEYNIKGLTIIHYDHNDNVTTYQLDYLKSDVERMLAYYKTIRKRELAEEQRKRIEF